MSELSDCKILIVDDTKTNIDVLVQTLKKEYKLGVALNGKKAIEYVQQNQVDLILLDILMPGMDGFETCQILKEDEDTKNIPVIFITAMDDPTHKTKAFEGGAVDYITKPFDIREVGARVYTHLKLKVSQEALKNQNTILEEKVKARTRELEETQVEIINRLGMASEYRDEETGKHIKRMSEYCRSLGKSIGLPINEYDNLALASTMHDAGKIGIPDDILLKEGKLSDNEWKIMKRHTSIGQKLLSGGKSKLMQTAEQIAKYHHEKWDGTGYNGLRGEEIPMSGRIACICDVFDALISKRPYKDQWSINEALKEIEDGKGSFFDPYLVDKFLTLEKELRDIIKQW
ncbi:MAG: two-component system response regulator [Desulfobacterales bacterium]|nr:two-component system response regulator [Desulfobacterales bacterium]MCP4160740.1 two-component system response regulator [Deltaproteobacteria bacterium]